MYNVAHRLTWANFLAVFGNKENVTIARNMRELAAASIDCAAKLDRELSLRERDVVDDEHRGDKALEGVENAIERGFVIRFGKGSPTQLAHELDDVIDGMRDVARHIETYRAFLDPFPNSSRVLTRIAQECVRNLGAMIDEVFGGHIDRERLNKLAEAIIDLERQADTMRAQAEKELASSAVVADFRSFHALKGLNDLLEGITDHAKHCAVITLAIVRQEA